MQREAADMSGACGWGPFRGILDCEFLLVSA